MLHVAVGIGVWITLQISVGIMSVYQRENFKMLETGTFVISST